MQEETGEIKEKNKIQNFLKTNEEVLTIVFNLYIYLYIYI